MSDKVNYTSRQCSKVGNKIQRESMQNLSNLQSKHVYMKVATIILKFSVLSVLYYYIHRIHTFFSSNFLHLGAPRG